MAVKTGRFAMLEQFLADGMQFMFGNPGTVEQGFLDALAEYPEMRYILTLQETVAVMVADGYARLAGDVVEAQPLRLARDAQPLSDGLAEQLILVRFRHRRPFPPQYGSISIEPGTMGKVNRTAARSVQRDLPLVLSRDPKTGRRPSTLPSPSSRT